MKCKSVISILEKLAPKKYAEDWDNVGLLLGKEEKEVKKIMVALDATENVINQAVKQEIDMLITHHPMLFSPIKSITSQDFLGKRIIKLLQNDISYYAMHTNFDVAAMADAVAEKLDLMNTRVFEPVYTEKLFKIAVFVPRDHAEKVRMAMVKEGAGFIGNYSGCTFQGEGIGTFIPLEGTNPYIGKLNETSYVNEIKIETIVDKPRMNAVIQAMIKVHPYEEPAYDIYTLYNSIDTVGIGKYGYLKQDISLQNLAMRVKMALNISNVQIVGDLEQKVASVVIVPGSGKSFLKRAIQMKADVYITGDIDHHTAIDAMEQGLCIIDAGHFGTEHIMVDYIKDYINNYLHNINWNLNGEDINVSIITAKESSPFITI